MSRQFGSPYMIINASAYKLQPAAGIFDESWLQNFIFTNYNIVPITEIEPVFGPLIPVCRELPTKAGPIDAIFINENGFLTLIECKLWKNPEARREVVGQILDYAKEISQWSYEDLQRAIWQAQKVEASSLYQLVASQAEDVDERDFIDCVSQNLRRGRFLLLILGDGIRENVEQIADFLQKYAHLNFSFALVEIGIYSLPDLAGDGYFIQPRLLTQTVEIERAVVRIENGQIAVVPEEPKTATARRQGKISEQVFFENLSVDPQIKIQLKEFFERVQNIGLFVQPGQNSMKLKSSLNNCNFGVFRTNGEFYNRGIASTTEEIGNPQLGEAYLDQLAKLLNDGYVVKGKNRFIWTVKVKAEKKDRYATAAELLTIQDQWLHLIEKTLNQLASLESE